MNDVSEVRRVAVVGSGYMGGGIAMVFARGGYDVTLADVDAPTAQRSHERVVREAEQAEDEGLLSAGSATRVRDRLSFAASIADAVATADFITEAVPERRSIKDDTLRLVSDAARGDAVIATNTSAIPIGELARNVEHPERFLGVHWMNPAPYIPGVEIIAGEETSEVTVELAFELIRAIGKTPARVADTPGFVANRLQFALYKEAVRIVEDGVASPAQIDTVVSNTFGFRLALFGPFAIGDMAGLDVYESSYRTLEDAFGERFATPAPLAALVGEGNLGVKSGRGYLDIASQDVAELLRYRALAYARLAQLRRELGPAPGLGGDED